MFSIVSGMEKNRETLDKRLGEFRNKYYTDKIIRGSLILAIIISSILFVALISEGLFGFSVQVRTGLVFGLSVIFAAVLGYMVLWPLSKLMGVTKPISDFQIAHMVRNFFPSINDKLINLLQLKSTSTGQGSLLAAAIEQKSSEITPVPLSKAINLQLNRRYIAYLFVPLLLFFVTYLINPGFIAGSGHRLINYRTAFTPPAPFQIQLSGIPQEVIAGQSMKLKVDITGNALPAELYIFLKKAGESQFIDYNLEKLDPSAFEYTITDIKEDFSLYIGNQEVSTGIYDIKVVKRPFIRKFSVQIIYPEYTGLAPEALTDNIGDFKVLRGSTVRWVLESQGEVEQAIFNADRSNPFTKDERTGNYVYTRRLMDDMNYFLTLLSPEKISNQDTVQYRASVIPDRYPTVYITSPDGDYQVDVAPILPLSMEIADDFGFNRMELMHRITKSGGTSEISKDYSAYKLEIMPGNILQDLDYQIDLTSLGFREGDELEFFVRLWDNDAISGPKFSTGAIYKVKFPTIDEKYKEVEKEQQAFKSDLKEMKQKAEDLEEAYKRLQEKLLDQKQLSFDDKKEIQKMVDAHQELMKEMEQAQKDLEQTKDKLDQNQMLGKETMEKFEQLNKFMEEMKNEKLEELLKELQEQLENLSPEDIKERLEKLQMNEKDIQKSLERTLELMKQLEVQQKIDELGNKVDNLKAKEEVLNEQLDKAKEAEELQKNADKQEDLSQQMDELQKELEDLTEMKENTQTPDKEAMQELMEKAEETKEEMQKASEETEKSAEQKNEKGAENKKASEGAKQKATQSQKKAAQKLQEMSESLNNMKMDMAMKMDQQNLESLRELLENLLKLSFDQEAVRDEVKKLKREDPAMNEKSRRQKKLQDDMELVQDSLEALANKVFEIQKMVLDESENIVQNMDKSQRYFRGKNVQMTNYHQTVAMTSMNNLANMLSNVMKQMQDRMMAAMAGQMGGEPQQGQQPQPGMKGLAESQEQLNKAMQQLMQGKMPGGGQLAEMAAKQQAIREKLQQLQQQMEKEGSGTLGDMGKVAEDMDETVKELGNGDLTNETLFRQRQILNRLLQADKSVRERDWDEKRESNTGKNQTRKSPDELTEEELKNRIRQELLKSNKLEYTGDFINLIERYYKKLESNP